MALVRARPESLQCCLLLRERFGSLRGGSTLCLRQAAGMPTQLQRACRGVIRPFHLALEVGQELGKEAEQVQWVLGPVVLAKIGRQGLVTRHSGPHLSLQNQFVRFRVEIQAMQASVCRHGWSLKGAQC